MPVPRGVKHKQRSGFVSMSVRGEIAEGMRLLLGEGESFSDLMQRMLDALLREEHRRRATGRGQR